MQLNRFTFGISFLAAALYGQPHYMVQGVGIAPGFATSTASAVNENGLVAGYSSTAKDANGHVTNLGFTSKPTACTPAPMETLNGVTVPIAIDNAEIIAGTETSSGTPRALAIKHGFADAVDLGGAFQTHALAMSDYSVVAGYQALADNISETAVYWTTHFQNSVITTSGPHELPEVVVNPPSGKGPVNRATGVNHFGQIVGWINAGSEVWGMSLTGGAANWTRISPVRASSTVFGLNLSTKPTAVNRQGHVVGIAGLNFNVVHAFLSKNFSQPAIDLGTLIPSDPTMVSIANAINVNDWVVGASSTVNNETHAFLYNGASMIDLNSRLLNPTGWILTAAHAISDNGVIVGEGFHNGRQEGFVLFPEFLPIDPCSIVSVPFPSPFSLTR
jgi:probable HAF family extracellular repeat protein